MKPTNELATGYLTLLEEDVERVRRELLRDIVRLRDRLVAAAEDLAAGRSLPSLGIVRELGTDVDQRCVALAYANKQRSELGVLVEAMRRPEGA